MKKSRKKIIEYIIIGMAVIIVFATLIIFIAAEQQAKRVESNLTSMIDNMLFNRKSNSIIIVAIIISMVMVSVSFYSNMKQKSYILENLKDIKDIYVKTGKYKCKASQEKILNIYTFISAVLGVICVACFAMMISYGFSNIIYNIPVSMFTLVAFIGSLTNVFRTYGEIKLENQILTITNKKKEKKVYDIENIEDIKFYITNVRNYRGETSAYEKIKIYIRQKENKHYKLEFEEMAMSFWRFEALIYLIYFLKTGTLNNIDDLTIEEMKKLRNTYKIESETQLSNMENL